MASLINKSPAETYKDLLTVSSSSPNQGLEGTSKRIFDGEGIGSSLYVGTSTFDVVGESTFTGTTTISTLVAPIMQGNTAMSGNMNITGNLTVSGTITNAEVGAGTNFDTPVITPSLSLKNVGTGATVQVMTMSNTSTVNVVSNLVTKGTMTFAGSSETLVIDAQNGGLQKGDGSKGKVTMKNDEVTLNKGSTELLSANQDGRISFQEMASAPSSPLAGDLTNINGDIFIAVP